MNESKMEKQYQVRYDSEKWDIVVQDEYEKSLLLFITGKCNLNCKNCFSISSRNSKEMTIEQIEAILEANRDIHKIDLMGGEPLLHSEIEEIIKRIQERGLKLAIYTNGILLERLAWIDDSVKVCISFHEIEAEEPSRKPLKPLLKVLKTFSSNHKKIKLVYLMDAYNYQRAMKIINYIDRELPYIEKLTIGLMRYENDYWNDEYKGVLPFDKYAETVEKILKEYEGRLHLDIFLKGVLQFVGLDTEKDVEHKVNRFRCIFQDMTYSDCLYDACLMEHPKLPTDWKLPISRERCKHTGRCVCLADKVRLHRKK